MAAPRIARSVQKIRVEGVWLCDEDSGGAERPTQQPHPPQLHAEPAHGQPRLVTLLEMCYFGRSFKLQLFSSENVNF